MIVEMLKKSKHIGIVACSAEGAALCFREIAAYSLNFMGEHLHPQGTDNSAHLAFKHVAARSPIPWLHIAEEVAKAALRSGYKHASLLGTRFTMRGPVYPEMFAKYNLKVSATSAPDQKQSRRTQRGRNRQARGP
jgi:aspartate racemase